MSTTNILSVKIQLIVGAFLVLLASAQLDAIVISEINYNPAAGAENLEFIEITNDNASAEDISGWAFVDGIDFEFPQGTVLHGGEIIVVCASEAAVQAYYGIDNTIGNYGGRLDAGGERLTLVNYAGVVMQDLRYNDSGKWPAAADGTGHSMVVKSVHLDTSEPESWRPSPELGGSPGFVNDPEGRNQFNESSLIEEGDLWSFKKGTGPFSDPADAWIESTFDDGSWDVGPSGFGYGDDDDNTVFEDMRNGYTSIAIRKSFDLSDAVENENSRFYLGVVFDDGFCAYVNGVEFARKNCPEAVTWDATATRSSEASALREELVEVPKNLLNPGDNVFALVVYNSRVTDTDVSLIPRLLRRDFIFPETGTEVDVVFNELYRGSPSTGAWVELFNREPRALDLSGWTITDDPDREDPFVLPDGSIVSSGEFLVVDEASSALALSEPVVKLFLIDPRGFVGSAAAFDESPTTPFPIGNENDEEPGAYAEARFPDGGRPGWVTPTPTPGAPNEVPRVTDIVINEIFYHPPEDRDGEFIEIYNRGSEAVDLSGFRFTRGIDYPFTAGTTIAAGGYLVVAEDPAVMRERYGLRQVLGPWEGGLANRGENLRLVDAAGNLVDEVRYFDGDRWSIWADGRGSSLELVDPRRDNDLPSSWGASDESEKSSWEEHSFTVDKYEQTPTSEVHLVLVERGVCRVDDISVITDRFEDTEIVPQGEEWRFLKGTAPFSTPENAWRDLEFNDTSWLVGASGFGYGDDDDATILDDMRENYSSIAVRKRFHVDGGLLTAPGKFVLAIDYDDGFCAYLNGVEIARSNCPDVPSHDAAATTAHEAIKEESFEVPSELVHDGENILAIVGFNRQSRGRGDTDFSLIPRFVHRRLIGLTDSYITNSGFEEETLPWIMEGTHAGTRRITDDARSGNACMEIAATGKGDTICNRVEIDTDPVLEKDTRYDISFWTRWIAGSSLLIFHGDFSSGPWPGRRDNNLSGNPLSKGVRMSVPWDLGTPGAENSQRALLRAETGSDNLGPGIADVVHSPLSPSPGVPVEVRARVTDPDGVETVRVFYKMDELDVLMFESVELFPDAGLQSPNTYVGEIPAIEGAAQVVFFVEAVDDFGAVSRFPAAGPEAAPENTLIYRPSGPVDQKIQMLLSRNSWRELQTRRLQSNDMVDGTFILDNEIVYNNVGMRYRGSPWGRGSKESLRVRFGNDQLYKGKFREINVSNRDRNDGAAYPLIGRNGTPEVPAPVAEYHYATARLNGTPFGTPGVFEPYGKQFIEKWFGEEAAQRGVLLKGIGRLRFDDFCNRTAWDEVSLHHRLENPENYRFYFNHSMNQSRDEWRPLMDMTRVLDNRVTPDAEFDKQFESVVDVQSFLGVLGPRILMNDGDALFIGNGHNGYLFWEPTEGSDELDGRWHYFPFDMGGAWGGTQNNLLRISDRHVLRFTRHPRTLRFYYRMLHEYTQGYWSEEAAGPFLDALAKDVQIGGQMKGFINASQSLLSLRLNPFLEAEFRILTNGGLDFETGAPVITLKGEASVLAVTLVARINGGEAEPFEPTWTSASEWSLSLPITSDVTQFELDGFDKDDQPVGTAAITIIRTAESNFSRGDVDGKGSVNVGDAITTLLYLFSGHTLACADAADFDDSGEVDLGDAVATLDYLFQQGDPPAAPFPQRGVDQTADALGDCRE